MPISTPALITVPFATSGLKNAIPSTANPVTGNAGYDAGFPAINMTPKEAGGIPPFGQDFNGILFAVTEVIRFLQAGGSYVYSSSFATAVGGYPAGTVLLRGDGTGFWRNTLGADNSSNPETGGAGWEPDGSGMAIIPMSNANVTLSSLQAARPIVTITGTLTANLNLIFPAYRKTWLVVNSASGAFSVTCKTASGSGVSVATGITTTVYGDATNILNGSPLGALGTAAYANIQTSLTDNTSGRVQINGAFGNGGQVVSTVTNLDTYMDGGRFVTPASGLTGLPTGWPQNRYIIEVSGGSAYCRQVLTGTQSTYKNVSASRTFDGTSFGPWAEILDLNNRQTIIVREMLAANTSVNGAAGYNKRTLNTVETNSIRGASLSAGSITLPAGTYKVEAWTIAYASQIRSTIRNSSSSLDLILGSSMTGTLSNSSEVVSPAAMLKGVITLASSTAIELGVQLIGGVTASQALGIPMNDGGQENYSCVEIERIG